MPRLRNTQAKGTDESQVIRDAIVPVANQEETQTSAYERLQPFIGIIEGGDPKLSEDTGKRLREILENRQRASHSSSGYPSPRARP